MLLVAFSAAIFQSCFAQGNSYTDCNQGQIPAQSDHCAHQETSDAQEDPSKSNKQSGGGSLVVAPLPISSPALGSGIVPVVAYIFPLQRSDSVSPPSLVGAAGLVTDNGSRAFVAGSELYLNNNRYRITGAFARGNLNYNLYALGSGSSQGKLPLKQTGHVLFVEALRRLRGTFFAGPRFTWGDSLITLQSSNASGIAVPPDLGLNTSLTAVGFRLQRDTRPNRFYATRGSLLDVTADFFSQRLGSKYSFQSYKLTFNTYWSATERQVIAFDSYACLTAGEPPFYGNCIYGTNNKLRGYVAGRYLHRYMLVSQLEYRLRLPWRLGLVGFGGVGEVIPGGNQSFRTSNFLPSGGAGVRFQLSKTYRVNLRVDFAQGVDGHTWSIGVGEAF